MRVRVALYSAYCSWRNVGPGQVEADRDVVRLQVGEAAQHDAAEPEDAVDELTLGGGERRQGVVAAVHEPEAVEQHQAFHGLPRGSGVGAPAARASTRAGRSARSVPARPRGDSADAAAREAQPEQQQPDREQRERAGDQRVGRRRERASAVVAGPAGWPSVAPTRPRSAARRRGLGGWRLPPPTSARSGCVVGVRPYTSADARETWRDRDAAGVQRLVRRRCRCGGRRRGRTLSTVQVGRGRGAAAGRARPAGGHDEQPGEPERGEARSPSGGTASRSRANGRRKAAEPAAAAQARGLLGADAEVARRGSRAAGTERVAAAIATRSRRSSVQSVQVGEERRRRGRARYRRGRRRRGRRSASRRGGRAQACRVLHLADQTSGSGDRFPRSDPRASRATPRDQQRSPSRRRRASSTAARRSASAAWLGARPRGRRRGSRQGVARRAMLSRAVPAEPVSSPLRVCRRRREPRSTGAAPVPPLSSRRRRGAARRRPSSAVPTQQPDDAERRHRRPDGPAERRRARRPSRRGT